jgi:hypothetical protein
MNAFSTRISSDTGRSPGWRACLCLAAACVLISFAISACGSSDPTILDTQKVEAAIEQSVLDQRGVHADVGCPAGVQQKKGLEFSCQATVKQEMTQFDVTQLDDAGNVSYVAP